MIKQKISTTKKISSFGKKYFMLISLIGIFLFLFYGQAFSQISVSFNSAIPLSWSDPVRITTDDSGNIYVTSPSAGKIFVLASNGEILNTITTFKKPLSIAVDSSGRLYVGDARDKSVSVLNADGQYLFKLGIGTNEFGMPGDMIIVNNYIYVTDGPNDLIKVYNISTGDFVFSFGQGLFPNADPNLGSPPLMFPTGIAYDNIYNEIYVSDNTWGRILVFGLDGDFKRYIGRFGSYTEYGPGYITRAQGLAYKDGRLYVVDTFEHHVQVFDRNGTPLMVIGTVGSDNGELRVPMDVVINGTKLYVTNSENRRIEIFDVFDPNGLSISRSSLDFTVFANTSSNIETITVDSQVAGNVVPWIATTSDPFIQISQLSGSTPSSIGVNVNATGLSSGNYSGEIVFTSLSNGSTYKLKINMTVIETRLVIYPKDINLYHQIGGNLPNASVFISSEGGDIQWSASSNVPWISLSSSSGVTPSSLSIIINGNANSLQEGTHIGVITVNAGGALGSPADIIVTLRTVSEGTIIVKTNLENASFSIDGSSANYTGSGREWRNENAKAGDYTITFDHVPGYRKPSAISFSLASGGTVTVEVNYQPLPVANVIVAGKAAHKFNNALVRLLDLNGALIYEFMPFNTMFGVGVAMGDVDGDGNGEIIVTTGQGSTIPAAMKIYRPNGRLISSVGPIPNTAFGANAASGDINGDGRYEIAMSFLSKDGLTQTVVVYSMDANNRLIEMARLSFASSVGSIPVNMTFGDIDGDGMLELIIARDTEILVYAFNEDMTPILVNNVSTAYPLKISSGDIDGDGEHEIITGYVDSSGNSVVNVLRGDLTDYGITFNVFIRGNAAPSLSSMDCDGDGIIEILAGKGPHRLNNAMARFSSSNGTILKDITAFPKSYGINIALGFVK